MEKMNAREKRIKVKKMDLPVGAVYVYQNGIPIYFQAEAITNGMRLDDGTYRKPEGLYRITVDMNLLQAGDVLVCELTCGHMESDGGDEHTLNMVGIIENYTVGMGTYDTEDINECCSEDHHWRMPYDSFATARGYGARFIDNPQEYKGPKEFWQLYFDIAWEPGVTEEAWNLVSFVTC